MNKYIARFQFARNKISTSHLYLNSSVDGETLPSKLLCFTIDVFLAFSMAVPKLKKGMEKRLFISNPNSGIKGFLISLFEYRALVYANCETEDSFSSFLRERIRSANFLWAKESKDNLLLSPIGHKFFEIIQFQDARLGVPLCLGSSVTFRDQREGDVSEQTAVSFYICPLESVSQKLRKKTIKLQVKLSHIDKSESNREIDICLDGSSGFWIWKPGSSWTEIKIPLSAPISSMTVSFECKLKKTPILPQFAIGSPKLEYRSKLSKKTVILVIESLSELSLVEKLFRVKSVENKLFAHLGPSAVKFENSFSAGDSTLPAAGTFATGTLPSTHQLGDYKPNPWRDFDCPQLSLKEQTVAETLGKAGVPSFMRASLQRFSPVYGFGRGFEGTYVRQNASVDLERAFLLGKKGCASHLFAHLDTMHFPLSLSSGGAGPDVSVFLGDDYRNPAEHYMNRVERSFELAISLVEHLKSLGDWENTTFIITGDHGASLPPWKKGLENSLYQLRTQVPLYVKPASGVDFDLPEKNEIINAHLMAHYLILKTHGIKSQFQRENHPEFGIFAISESTHQPQKDDYAVCLTFEKFRYFHRAKVDWKTKKYLQPIFDALYEKDPASGLYNEAVNLIDRHPEKQKQLREYVGKMFNRQEVGK